MAQPRPEHTTVRAATSSEPRSADELRAWVRAHLHLDPEREADLLHAIDIVLGRQRQLVEESKHEAIRALSEGFAAKMERLQMQLTEKDVTVSNIARYFEEVVADLTEKSHRDPKTKLLNFDWFMERLESFLSVEQRVRWCGVGVVDITNFKSYNDTLGHPQGDRCLAEVAEAIRQSVSRAGDLPARYGGEEFVILIPAADHAAATVFAERLRQTCEARAIPHPSSPVGQVVTISLGVASCIPTPELSAAGLVAEADAALYRAKQEGRNRVR